MNTPNETATPSLLTVHQLAERLHVSTTWVYRNARDLPFTRFIGKNLRFDPRGIERWLESRRPT